MHLILRRLITIKGEKFFSIFILIILCSFGAVMVFGSHKDFSEEENRSLSTSVQITPQSIVDGKFFSGVSDFCRDQFPGRDLFLRAKVTLERMMFRTESNGVIFGYNGYLVARHDYGERETLKKNLAAISDFSRAMNNEGKQVSVAVAPRAIDVLGAHLPATFPSLYSKNIYSYLAGYDLTDGRKAFRGARPDEYIWYRTDHHWTTHGAYLFYLSICDQLGIEAYDKSFFDIQQVSDRFLGTTYSKVLTGASDADKIELYRYAHDNSFSLYFPTSNKSMCGFYDFSALEKKDKYQIFLSGNTDIIQIRENGMSDKPRLLLIKDSFANSLVPFLALHFDIDLIDLRYFEGSVTEYAEANGFDTVAILCGIDTLATERRISLISA